MAADIGTGTAITFSTSGYSAQITDIKWTGITRPTVDISHLGTTTARAFMSGDLYDAGSLKLEVLLDSNWTGGATRPNMNHAGELITVTFPDGNTVRASGFFTDWEMGVPLEDKMTASVTAKFTDAITVST